jgi:hypothetical protein
MFQNLLNGVFLPLLRRLGSLAAGAAVTYGATVDQSLAIEAGVIAASGLVVDLLLSKADAKKKKLNW